MAEVYQGYTVVCTRCRQTILLPAKTLAPGGDRGFILGDRNLDHATEMVRLDIVAADARRDMANVTPPGWNLQAVSGNAKCERCFLEMDLTMLSGKRFADAGVFNCDYCHTENFIEMVESSDKSVASLIPMLPMIMGAVEGGRATDDMLMLLASIRILRVGDDSLLCLDRLSTCDDKARCNYCGKENALVMVQASPFE